MPKCSKPLLLGSLAAATFAATTAIGIPQAAAAPDNLPDEYTAPAQAVDSHSSIEHDATDDVERWIGEARRIMIEAGIEPQDIDANDLAIIAMHESSGDPDAVNDWDSNAAMGTPSTGLMQTIQPTFDAYALEGHTDIHDPVDNIIAASRYAIDRYGSVSEAPGPESVNKGGEYKPY